MKKPTKPHNPNSAFHWREQPLQIDWRGKSARQMQLDATRQNREVPAGGAFLPGGQTLARPRGRT